MRLPRMVLLRPLKYLRLRRPAPLCSRTIGCHCTKAVVAPRVAVSPEPALPVKAVVAPGGGGGVIGCGGARGMALVANSSQEDTCPGPKCDAAHPLTHFLC